MNIFIADPSHGQHCDPAVSQQERVADHYHVAEGACHRALGSGLKILDGYGVTVQRGELSRLAPGSSRNAPPQADDAPFQTGRGSYLDAAVATD
jgi:hypothetical protein